MPQYDQLSTEELNWLLTQGARAAAQTLRQGVARLTLVPTSAVQEDAPTEIESSLAAIDNAMRMLDSLNAQTNKMRIQGRVDMTSLVVDLAPQARLRLEPGSGTEVYGDESDLRRMVRILMGHAGPMIGGIACPEVTIVREGDDVRVSVALGPEGQSGDVTERVWLGRMASRYGGRLELEGGQESLVLPANDGHDERDMVSLRTELEDAYLLGEACAKELAELCAANRSSSALPKTLNVVVVEPQESIRRITEALVRGCGHNVVSVGTGAKALETCLQEPPDVVLLALLLPGKPDGFEVCRRIRSDDSTRHIPIIVITSLSDSASRKKAANAGATHFFAKPFSPTELLRRLETSCDSEHKSASSLSTDACAVPMT